MFSLSAVAPAPRFSQPGSHPSHRPGPGHRLFGRTPGVPSGSGRWLSRAEPQCSPRCRGGVRFSAERSAEAGCAGRAGAGWHVGPLWLLAIVIDPIVFLPPPLHSRCRPRAGGRGSLVPFQPEPAGGRRRPECAEIRHAGPGPGRTGPGGRAGTYNLPRQPALKAPGRLWKSPQEDSVS